MSVSVSTDAPVSATAEIEALTGLADLVLALGRVERITCHPDGATRESDTDHSLMLVIVGCAFAARHFPDLDLGAVAHYAAVHDLVEAMDGVGDTPTLVITAEEHATKTAREAVGWEQLRRRYGAAFPWLSATIDAYLRQDSAEARFVWGLDKELPKLTHLLNGCTTHRALRMTAEQVDARYRERLTEMSPHLADLPALLALCEELITRVGDAVRHGSPPSRGGLVAEPTPRMPRSLLDLLPPPRGTRERDTTTAGAAAPVPPAVTVPVADGEVLLTDLTVDAATGLVRCVAAVNRPTVHGTVVESTLSTYLTVRAQGYACLHPLNVPGCEADDAATVADRLADHVAAHAPGALVYVAGRSVRTPG